MYHSNFLIILFSSLKLSSSLFVQKTLINSKTKIIFYFHDRYIQTLINHKMYFNKNQRNR